MHIAVSIDRKYVQPLGVMLNSLLMNTRESVSIHLLHPDLAPEDMQRLETVIGQYPQAALTCYHLTAARLQGFALRGHLSVVGYYLFLLPEILPANVDKVLYLDPDLIVTSDLRPLWEVELEDHLLAAIPVPPAYFHEKIVTPGQDYFNGGVLLINLKQWRDEGTTEKALETVTRLEPYIQRGINQDVLNVVTRDRWKRLPLLWNKCPEYYLGWGGSTYEEEELRTAKEDAGIIHFAGPVKPWHYACSHPERNAYLQYRKGTPWEGEPLTGKNVISFVSRILPLSLTTWISAKLAHTAVADKIKKLAFG